MANLKAIKKRIQGVTGTEQLTRAMKLVAAAKLRRAQENAVSARAYGESLDRIIQNLAGRLEGVSHPLMARREPRKALLLIYTSDRGLCGAFNLNVCRAAQKFIEEPEGGFEQVDVAVIGKKGNEYLQRRDCPIRSYYQDMFGDISFDRISRIGNELAQAYVDGEYDGLFVLYNWFKSAASQRVTLKRILPVGSVDDQGAAVVDDQGRPEAPGGLVRWAADTLKIDLTPPVKSTVREHLFEPDRTTLLDIVFPMYVNMELYQALLESVASEMGARMTAMDNATANAKDLIKRLTLAYNKARQEAITTELMDIVGGAEALR